MKRLLSVTLALLFSLLGFAYAENVSPSALKRVFRADRNVGGTYNPMSKPAGVIYPLTVPDSPGDSIDFTWYEYQTNGSSSRRIALDHVGAHGLHVVYMKAPNYTWTPRNVAYQYNDRSGSGWSGEIDMNTGRAGLPTLATLANGQSVVAFSENGGTVVVVGGVGTFYVDTLTYPRGSAGAHIWPHVAASGNSYIHVAAHQNSISRIMKSTSSDTGKTWSHWAFLQDSTDTSIQNDISQHAFTGPNGKVAIAWTQYDGRGLSKQWCMDVWYVESTDYGATWGTPVNVTSYTAADTVKAYNCVDGLYDASGNMHLVWTGQRVLGDTALYAAAAIFHWSSATGINVVSGAGNVIWTYWWTFSGMLSNFSSWAERPSLSYDSTGNLFCVWEGQKDMIADTGADGYENYDLYAEASTDGGASWTWWLTPVNLTNSHYPGCPAGDCVSDEWNSTAEFAPDSVRIEWIVDRDPGSAPSGQGATMACPVKYMGVPKPPGLIGVEEGQKPTVQMPSQYALGMARPNPVGRLAEISYALPVARTVNLSVFNMAGELVQVLESGSKAPGFYSARWNAGSVPAGVYFYRLTAGEFTQTRAMVVVK